MADNFTDEELLAYADENLSDRRSVEVEQALRQDSAVGVRLADLLAGRDQGAHTLGQIWRRDRLSCPSRSVWCAYVDNRLGDGLTQYLRFHLDTVGCRVCAANLEDLRKNESATEGELRTRKIFQSSAGILRRDLNE